MTDHTRAQVLDVFRAAQCTKHFVVLTNGMSFEANEPDSLSLVELVMEAERAFKIEVPDAAFMHCRTVGEVADAVVRVMERRQRPALAVYDGGLAMREPAKDAHR